MQGKENVDRHELETERAWTISKQSSTFSDIMCSSSSGRRDQSGIMETDDDDDDDDDVFFFIADCSMVVDEKLRLKNLKINK